MSNSNNIEDIFKKHFEHFEPEVNHRVWSTIKSKINPVVINTTTSVSSLTAGKILALVGIISVITSSVWYFSKKTSTSPISQPSESHSSVITSSEINKQQDIISNKDTAHTGILSDNKAVPEANTHSNQSKSKVIIDNSPSVIIKDVNKDAVTPKSTQMNNSEALSLHNMHGESSSNNPSASNKSPVKSNENIGKSIVVNTQQGPGATINATITASTSSGDAPLTINFSNQGTTQGLSWDFGDGITSKESNPTHTFEKAGNYTITLIAKDASLTVTDKMTITVNPISEITFIPNIFSPNGDGKNDYFYFKLKNIQAIDVEIQNLSRNTVYKWAGVEGKWDGKNLSGTDVPAGLYLYVVKAIGTDGRPISKKGSITLER